MPAGATPPIKGARRCATLVPGPPPRGDPRCSRPGSGVYPLLATSNHSCIPNVARGRTRQTAGPGPAALRLEYRALMDLKPGTYRTADRARCPLAALACACFAERVFHLRHGDCIVVRISQLAAVRLQRFAQPAASGRAGRRMPAVPSLHGSAAPAFPAWRRVYRGGGGLPLRRLRRRRPTLPLPERHVRLGPLRRMLQRLRRARRAPAW